MDRATANYLLAMLVSRLQREGLSPVAQLAAASHLFSHNPAFKPAFDTVSEMSVYEDSEGIVRSGQNRKGFYMSEAKPYWEALLSWRLCKALRVSTARALYVLQCSTERPEKQTANSKRVAFAMFNHYYSLSMNLLVSGEQEKWPLENAKTKKGHETGPYIPDLIVEGFVGNGVDFPFRILSLAKSKEKNQMTPMKRYTARFLWVPATT
ncbi:MAG: hypothetical protein Q9175_007736 [Cornicularia normoerica]